jgi:hypothetical protein
MESSPAPLTQPESPNRAVVRIIYFIPTDRQPEPDFRDRLDRVMTDVQQFYRLGMEQNGYGKITGLCTILKLSHLKFTHSQLAGE